MQIDSFIASLGDAVASFVPFELTAWRVFAVVGIASVAIVHFINKIAVSARRRAAELRAAEMALQQHYTAMATVVDDPALPYDALEMLTFFSDAIESREFCDGLTDQVAYGDVLPRPPMPAWFEEMQKLRRTRPDLVDNFNKAIGAGIAAAFLRWPNNSSKLVTLASVLAGDTKKEAAFAANVSARRKDRSGKSGGSHNGSANGIAAVA